MARSSVFAFIGVCLAVVAAGSSSVSGKGTKGLGIATEKIACERKRKRDLLGPLSLFFLFAHLGLSPPPPPPPFFYPILSKTAAPARSLLEKAGGEGE